MTHPPIGQLVMLVKALSRLTLPAEAQVQYLRAHDLPEVDELALEFSEGVPLIRQFVDEGWLSTAEADAIVAVDAALERMSGEGHEALWTESALHVAPEWDEVRRLARQAVLG
jgi:hypothetical protein